MSSFRDRMSDAWQQISDSFDSWFDKYRPTVKKYYKKVKPYMPKIKTRRWWTLYDHIVYNLDILVPEPDPEKIESTDGKKYVQEVHIGKKVRWRAVKDPNASLTSYLRQGMSRRVDVYEVIQEFTGKLPILDGKSKFIKKWDTLMIILLGFTATVIPFETAFIHEDKIDNLFLLNRLVDILFLTDMFIQCLRPYKDSLTGKLVTNHRKIFKRYVSTWFFVDLISVIPFELVNHFVDASDVADMALLRLLRFLRLMRLLKLLRMLRATRKLRELQNQVNLKMVSLQIVKLCVLFVILMHWLACGYKIAGDQVVPTDPKGWVYFYIAEKGPRSIGDLYMTALFWSSTKLALTSPGAAALIPHSDREYIYYFIVNLIAFGNFLYMLAMLTDVISASNKRKREAQMRIDNYQDMFKRLRMKNTLKNRIQEYWEDFESVELISSSTKLIQALPPQLKSYITVTAFVHLLEKIPFIEPFLPFDPLLVQELATGVEIHAFSPHTNVFLERVKGVYMVERGIISIEGRLYTSGCMFGLNCMREKLKRTNGRALTFVTVYLLPKEFIDEVLENYPPIKKYARKWTLWDAVRSYIRTYATTYYELARNGDETEQKLESRRPNMTDEEEDEIDEIVRERMAILGY